MDKELKRVKAVYAEIKKAEEEMENNLKTSILYIVHFKLPIFLSKSDAGVWKATWDPDSIIAATDGSVSNHMQTKWVGSVYFTSPGCSYNPCDYSERSGVIAACAELNCYPIFIEQDIIDDFYRGYVQCVLYPTFNNILEVYDDSFGVSGKNIYERKGYDHAKLNRWYRAFVKVNDIFGQHLVDLAFSNKYMTNIPISNP